jgi:hypothetical protein
MQLDVDLDVLGKAADIELGLLARVEVTLMAQQGVVAVRVLLDRGVEG